MEIQISEMSKETLRAQKRKIEEELKSRRQNADYRLGLRILEGVLEIGLDEYGVWKNIGFITLLGKCFFLNCQAHHRRYESWVKSGQKVNSGEVDWRGRRYYLNSGGVLSSVRTMGGPFESIYNFKKMMAFANGDENIVRYEHNGIIKLF